MRAIFRAPSLTLPCVMGTKNNKEDGLTNHLCKCEWLSNTYDPSKVSIVSTHIYSKLPEMPIIQGKCAGKYVAGDLVSTTEPAG